MGNNTTQTTNVFVGHKKTNPKKKTNTLISKIVKGVIIGLLVLWIWNHFFGTNSSNQEQMQKDREILSKEKG